MKKHILLFLSAMALMIGFASCNKDNDDDTPTQTPRKIACNELEYVVGQFCYLDENNNPVDYLAYRKDPEAAPSEFTMLADSRKEVNAILIQILPIYASDAIKNGGTQVQLYDTTGHMQCTLTLAFVDKADEIATLTFSEPNPFSRIISKVHFVPSNTWSENDNSNIYYPMPGNGNAENPFLIQSYSHLRTLAYRLNQSNIPNANYYKLTADIDCEGNELLIGTFSGVLDGDGHSISNYKIKSFTNRHQPSFLGYSLEAQSYTMAGLFMYLNCAIIKNLNLYPNKYEVSDQVTCVGQLAPVVNLGHFENIHVYNAQVDAAPTQGTPTFGGLFGAVAYYRNSLDGPLSYANGFYKGYTEITPVEIINCSAEVNFNITSGPQVRTMYVGGFIGWDNRTVARDFEYFPLKDCTSSGYINVCYECPKFDTQYINTLFGFLDNPYKRKLSVLPQYGLSSTVSLEVVKK